MKQLKKPGLSPQCEKIQREFYQNWARVQKKLGSKDFYLDPFKLEVLVDTAWGVLKHDLPHSTLRRLLK
jgi:hypothetical protein